VTFERIVRAHAFGLVHPTEMHVLLSGMPMFKAWCKAESRTLRGIVEAGAIGAMLHDIETARLAELRAVLDVRVEA
jgi:hypothetical protein